MANNIPVLTREEVAKILRARPGSITRCAKALNITAPAISQWLANRGRDGNPVSVTRLDRELPAFALGLIHGEERSAL